MTFSLYFLLMLRYCVLHIFACVRHFVHWNWCVKALSSTVACCNCIVLCNSVCAGRRGMALSRLLEWYLFAGQVQQEPLGRRFAASVRDSEARAFLQYTAAGMDRAACAVTSACRRLVLADSWGG